MSAELVMFRDPGSLLKSLFLPYHSDHSITLIEIGDR